MWGDGDGSTLTVIATEYGKMGGLICWENYMPLARMALYAKGVELYLAPTADSRDTWQATLRHIACEGRCFVLGCNQYVTKAMYPADLPGIADLAGQPEVMCRGGSVIVSPLGDVIAGPLFDQEGILYAELDLADVVRSEVRFRRSRPLRAAGRVPVDGQRAADGAGAIEFLTDASATEFGILPAEFLQDERKCNHKVTKTRRRTKHHCSLCTWCPRVFVVRIGVGSGSSGLG